MVQDDCASTLLTCSDAGQTYTYTLDAAGKACIVRCDASDREVTIPDTLQGAPVVEIGTAAFAGQKQITTLVCPPHIAKIGLRAFGDCKNLRRIVLPDDVEAIDQSWIYGCSQLEDFIMPAHAKEVEFGFFSACYPRRISIGVDTRRVTLPRNRIAGLTEFIIDADNPYLMTDGRGLYSKDGATLFSSIISEAHFPIREGCKVIASRAFAYDSVLEEPILPASLETVKPHAFLGSGIVRFEASASLYEIGDHAFHRCPKLEDVVLNDGLEIIGEQAFYRCTRVRSLHAPATLREFGHHATEGCALESLEAGFAQLVDPDNPFILVDADGVLYRKSSEGFLLVETFNPRLEIYRVLEGTVEIRREAFYRHGCLREIELPDGLRRIGDAAFSDCRHLKRVTVPESLERIGAKAFFGTTIRSMYLPSRCLDVGESALVANGAGDQDRTTFQCPSNNLKEIIVASGNPLFFMQDDTLFERKASGSDEVKLVLYLGSASHIRIPDAVYRLAPYAFAGTTSIEEIILPFKEDYFGEFSLTMNFPPKHIVVELAEPIEGRSTVEVFPLQTDSGQRAFGKTFVTPTLDVRELVYNMDSSVLYHMGSFERFRRMVERLDDPFLLDGELAHSYQEELGLHAEEACLEFARHDYSRGFDLLAKMGFLNEDNIMQVIDDVNEENAVAMTAYLLNMKQRLFGRSRVSFDL